MAEVSSYLRSLNHKDLESYINKLTLSRLGSCCSHAAAVLFKIELYVRMGRTEKAACTSGACLWKDMSRREVQPAPMKEICFQKPKRLDRQLQADQKEFMKVRKCSVRARGM